MKPSFPHAFTLVEILVVIAIIAIFAVIGLGSYRGARNTLVIDLEADKLVAFLQSAREETREAPHCVVIQFLGGALERYQVPFINPVAGCGEIPQNGATISPISFPFDKDVSLAGIILDGKQQTSAKIIFSPPNGRISFGPAGAQESLSLGLNSVPGLIRTVTVTSATGQIEKIKN